MMLVFSFEDRTFDDLKDLLLYLNQHVDFEDYAMILKRTKKSKLRITCKTWIICDRDRKSHECIEQNRRYDDSKHIKCSFSIIAKLSDENIDFWLFDIKNEEHNHASSILDVHLVLRRIIITREMKSEIKRQLTIQVSEMSAKENSNYQLTNQIFSFKIISIVHFSFTFNLSVVFNFESFDFVLDFILFNFAFINSFVKTRDIYNINTQMRRDELESMTSMQTMLHQLDENDWRCAFQKNRLNQMTHLFFSKKTSQSILKINYKVLIMNCTYKTNRYEMSLMIISDEIVLHKIFYVLFCFMTKKNKNDDVWILQQLKRFVSTTRTFWSHCFRHEYEKR